jgi:HSP20 family protein
MADIHSIRWHRIEGQLGEVVYALTRVQFSQFPQSQVWRPAINAYRCRDGIVVCVDLAGVARDEIELLLEPRRLLLRGHRTAPEPDGREQECLQVFAMEIDSGPFERELALPVEIDPARARAEQRNGLLWISLTIQAQA